MANHENEISVAERQLYILSLLSQNPIGYTADEIVDKLKKWGVELTKRTINRDIDELSLSYAIEEEEREGRTYYLARKFNMENVELTIMDLMAITFMQKLVAQYQNTTIGEAAGTILSKMTDHTSNLNKKHLGALEHAIENQDINEWKNKDVNPEYERMLSAAIDKHMKVKIEYYSWNSDEVTTRVIHPYRLIFLNQYLNVEGYCELRKEVRTFRLSRIKEITALKDHFEMNEAYESREQEKFIYISGKKPEQMKVHFNYDTGRYIKEYQSHLADRILDLEDGILFEKTTSITDEVIKWILQYGSGAKVLEPVWLAEKIQKEAELLSARYQR